MIDIEEFPYEASLDHAYIFPSFSSSTTTEAAIFPNRNGNILIILDGLIPLGAVPNLIYVPAFNVTFVNVCVHVFKAVCLPFTVVFNVSKLLFS